MNLKIDNLIHPFSSGFSAVSSRQLINSLVTQYNELEEKLDVMAFYNKHDVFFYMTLPSQTNAKYVDDAVEYDLVIQLIPPNSAWNTAQNIRDFDVKVFSNEPNFMFTFTYALKQKNGLIKMPNGYYGKLALKKKPSQRNPYLLTGIDRGIWIFIKYLERHGLFNREALDELVKNSDMDYNKLLKEIKTQDEKYAEVNERSERHRVRPIKKKKDPKSRWYEGNEKTKHRFSFFNLRRKKTQESLLAEPMSSDSLNSHMSSSLHSQLKSEMLHSQSINITRKSSLSTNRLKSSL